MYSSDSEEIECDKVIVDQLHAEPLLAAVFMDGQYAIVSKLTHPLNLRTYWSASAVTRINTNANMSQATLTGLLIIHCQYKT